MRLLKSLSGHNKGFLEKTEMWMRPLKSYEKLKSSHPSFIIRPSVCPSFIIRPSVSVFYPISLYIKSRQTITQPRKPGSLYFRGLRLRPWWRLITWDSKKLLPVIGGGGGGECQITCFYAHKNVTLHLQGAGHYVLFCII